MLKTALHEEHIKNGAKMGAFAGYDMPLYYNDGVMKEHEWVRSHAGLFDVSHMGQIILSGPGTQDFLEILTPSSFGKAPVGRAKYTVLTNPEGGIVDDLIITRMGDEKFFAVINAGCKDKDIAWIKDHLPESVTLEILADRSLLALQGQEAESVLREVLQINASDMPYMWMKDAALPDGTPIYVSRLGYTGEDGFELSIPSDKAAGVWQDLLAHDSVKPIGLAARDSLRLEMGYCLYSHDIDATTTPIEAGLGWVMGKENTGFIGADKVMPQKANGAPRLRVGIRLTGKGIARENTPLYNEAGEQVGMMTSGGFSPSLQASVGQGYVESDCATEGTKLFADVRGRKIEAEVAAMPFLAARTKSMKKQAA